MTNLQIIEKAIAEVETEALGVTAQFLDVHNLVYVHDEPKIARLKTDKEDGAVVYFNVEGQKFFFAVYVDLKPVVKVRWTNTEPYHSVYFRASSEVLSSEQLAQMTKLISSRGRNRGDKRHPEGGKSEWKRNTIDFEPNLGADDFEDKLTKLLDYLEQDIIGVKNLVNRAGGYIQVYSSFYIGNTMIGGHHIDRDHIKRMGKLNLEIDFDISADGNYFI